MATFLVVGEVDHDGALTKLSTEVATLARRLADDGGGTVDAIVSTGSTDAATELARFTGGRVAVRRGADLERQPLAGSMALDALEMARTADVVLLPASANGRDAAGILSSLTGRGVLANATAVRWDDGGPIVEMSAFGGKLITESAFSDGRGFVTIRPNAIVAEPAAAPGSAVEQDADGSATLAAVDIVDRVAAESAAVSIDDARVIVAGGRGVGGSDGFALVGDLADALGGAVGATRAAVDSGWIGYSQQIGQTGKIVKPQLYLALGISGAIQHKVGMQTADTIIAINRDPDAPIADFADVLVVGDLFDVGNALLAALRARTG